MTRRRILLGLSGPRGAGKDEAARFLVEEYRFASFAFADPIREQILRLYPGWTAEHMEHPLKDEVCPVYGLTPRAALQAGDAFRQADPLVYIRALEARVVVAALEQSATGHQRRIVVRDVRLESEADWIRRTGGVMVHVSRRGHEWLGDRETEHGIRVEPNDMQLRNAGSLETYRIQIRALMALVLGGAHGVAR